MPTDPAPAPSDPRPWRLLGSVEGPGLIVCRARFDDLEHPLTGAVLRRTVLETPDWVNVVALTPERRVVVVRQYRFGTRTVTTEIPGGVIDPGEEPLEAARRELREETGHTAESWRYLGSVEPNPAFQDNLCHHWLALDARPTHALALDPGEDIAVDTLDADEVRAAVRDGRMRHSLVLSALARVPELGLFA